MSQSSKTKPDISPVTLFSRIADLLVCCDKDPKTIVESILEQAMLAMGADRAFIAMVDYEHGELAVRYTTGMGWNEISRKIRLKVSQETGKGITSHVAAIGKPYMTGDVTKDPYYMEFFMDVKSEIAVPIFDNENRVAGVINIESVENDAFTPCHAEMLETVARLVSLRIQADKQRKTQAALVTLGRELSRTARSTDLYRKVIEVVAQAMSFEDCSIFLLKKADNTLVLEASRGSLQQKVHEASYAVGEGITGWVAANGQTVRLSDPRYDSRWRGLHEEYPPEEVGGLLVVPIFGFEGLLGVLRLLRRRSQYAWVPNAFTDEEEELAEAIAAILGAVIDSVDLTKRLVNTERMAAWGEMSARSAHMIGNRVFAIKGDLNELNHLMETGASPEEQKSLITSLEKGIFRLEEILSEFREFVMATKLKSAPTDINELVKDAVTEAFPKKSNVQLDLRLEEGLPLVEADTSKLRRCFSELVENSFNFQQEGGTLLVATESVSSGRDMVRVVVEDHGPGIPDDMKKQIFRPFFSTRSKGMGLGLSIVKGIVDAHSGYIKETGKEGEGARFEIYLPAVPADSDRDEHNGSEER